MKVYTFSTGGCRDGIYLDELSKTKSGVKKLLETYVKEQYLNIEEDIEISEEDVAIDVIISYYDDTLFSEDDFFCNL